MSERSRSGAGVAERTAHWTGAREGAALVRAAIDALLDSEALWGVLLERLTRREFAVISESRTPLGQAFRAQMASGITRYPEMALASALLVDGDGLECKSPQERRQVRDRWVELLDVLGGYDAARARALLKRALDEHGTPVCRRLRRRLPDPGDCPVCGERTGTDTVAEPTAWGWRQSRVTWCEACGWDSAED